MKSIKYLLVALVAAAGLSTACSSDDDFTPGPQAEGAQVYFSSEAATTYTIAADDRSVAVEVMRAVADEAIEVPVLATIDPEYAALFNVPDVAEFAAGENKTTLVITFDRSKLADGASYGIALQLDDETMTTPYGAASLNITVTVPEPYVLLGTGLYRDDILTSLFNVENVEMEVEIYENTNRPGYIFLKNVYTTSAYPYKKVVYAEGDHYLAVNIANPDEVFIPKQTLGMTLNEIYGEFYTGTISAGKLENGIITFPVKGLGFGMLLYEDGATYYANTNGLFRIVMPGAVLTDYTVGVTYAGRFTDVENKSYAVAEVTGGEDVEYIEVGMGAGSDANAVLAAIAAGEIETVRIDGKSGEARFAAETDGTYTIVAVSYGAGEAQEAAAATFDFYVGAIPELGPLEKAYTTADLYTISKEQLFKPWYMWARDYFDEENDARQPLSVVTFSENTENDDPANESDAINVSGLTLGAVENDTMVWEYYKGVIYNLAQTGPIGMWKDFYIGLRITDMTAESLYKAGNYMLVGGIVDEGYVALVSNNENYAFDGFALPAFKDAAMTESAGGSIAFYYDIVFEDPAVSELTPAAAAAPKAALKRGQLHTLASSLSVRDNYVETPRGFVHSKIDAMQARQREARMEAAPADAVVKTFRGTAAGLYELSTDKWQPANAELR